MTPSVCDGICNDSCYNLTDLPSERILKSDQVINVQKLEALLF